MKRYYSRWMRLIILFNIISLHLMLKYKNVSKIYEQYVYKSYKYPEKVLEDFDTHEQVTIDRIVKSILINVEDIASMCPFDAKCIHKSFIAFKLLRRYTNLSVKLVIGISSFPFQAHAWIKYKEYNLVDDYLETDKYKVILDSNNFGV